MDEANQYKSKASDTVLVESNMERDNVASYDVTKYDIPEEETNNFFTNIKIKAEDEDDDITRIVLPTRQFSDKDPYATPDNPSAYTKGIVVPASGAGEKTFIVTKVHKRKTKQEVQQKVN